MSQKMYAALLCYIHSAVDLSLFLSDRDLKFGLPFGHWQLQWLFQALFLGRNQTFTRHFDAQCLCSNYIVCILELYFMHSTASKMCLFVGKTCDIK